MYWKQKHLIPFYLKKPKYQIYGIHWQVTKVRGIKVIHRHQIRLYRGYKDTCDAQHRKIYGLDKHDTKKSLH